MNHSPESNFDEHNSDYSDVRVHFGRPGDLTDERMEEFARILVTSVFHPAEKHLGGPDFEKAVRYYREEIRHLLAMGELMVGKLNDETIGIEGFNFWGEFQGRNVCELTKGVVLKEHQGKGVYKKIKKSLMAFLREDLPESPIIGFTRDQNVINHTLKQYPGTRVISLDSNDPIAILVCDRFGPVALNSMKERGVQILWYDPEEQSD